MSMISKMCRSIASDRSLDKIKWEGGKLTIFQTKNGYAFYFIIDNNARPLSHFYPNSTYQFEISQENGIFKEEREMDEPRSKSRQNHRHSWTVPDQLFSAISELIRHNEVSEIEIEDIPLNTPFLFDKLLAVLVGHRKRLIEFTRTRGVTTDDIRKMKETELHQAYQDAEERIYFSTYWIRICEIIENLATKSEMRLCNAFTLMNRCSIV
ncbi:hypothetical protein PENTCL1PPCAC_1032 [Pristionchus entomophagus]|uniref:Uncharacterized protein n=1 Tax=Pristionchus entomophagus TaxID=358040 RepID=A0AAV5S9C6_9BILA|nr:hypothetical protein PENTCL1PPCAC_1032 [Pristionchus entomophagus]